MRNQEITHYRLKNCEGSCKSGKRIYIYAIQFSLTISSRKSASTIYMNTDAPSFPSLNLCTLCSQYSSHKPEDYILGQRMSSKQYSIFNSKKHIKISYVFYEFQGNCLDQSYSHMNLLFQSNDIVRLDLFKQICYNVILKQKYLYFYDNKFFTTREAKTL